MTAQDLKNSILQLAVQGKLVPQDPSDEPVDLKGLKLKNTDECEFDIPFGWRLAHLESISTGVPSKQYQILESEVKQSGKYFVISQSKAYSIGFTDNIEKVYSHKQPVVVFGDHTTEVKYLDFDFVVGADGVKIFEPVYQVVTAKFLFYTLQFYSVGLSKVGGYSRHYKFIKNKPIPLPPIAEQERIVSKIEELMSLVEEYGKAEEQIKALNAEFPDKLRKSILQQAVQGKLTERDPSDEPASELLKRIRTEKAKLIAEGKIKKEKPLPPVSNDEMLFDVPDGWEWIKLGDVATVLGGKRIPAGRTLTTENTGHKYIRVSDMKNGSVETKNLLFVPKDIYPSISRYVICKEDVYITVAGTIGRVGKIPTELDGANLTENADRLIFKLIDQDWMIQCLASPLIQQQIEDATKKVGQPKLAIKRIQELLIPLPPLAEQKRIVARVEELLAACDGLK